MRAIISRYLIFLWLIQIAIPFTPVVYTEEKTDAITLSQGAGTGLPVLFIASLCASVFSANKEFVGGTDSTWNTAANWNPSGVPATTDSVILDSNATKNCGLNAAGSVKKFTIKSNFTRTFYQLTNTLTVGNGGFSQAGGTFTGEGNTITLNGNFTLSGGTFSSTTGAFVCDTRFFTITGGTFTHNNGMVKFISAGGVYDTIAIGSSLGDKLTLGSLWFYSSKGDWYNTWVISSGDTLKVTGTYKQSGVYSARVNTGVIEAQDSVIVSTGNINYHLESANTATLLINGNKTQYYARSNGFFSNVNVNTTGSFVAASGTTKLGVVSFTLEAGTFSAPSDTLIITGNKSVSKTCNLTVNGGVFTHNNGMVMFDHFSEGTDTIKVGSSLGDKLTLGSLWFRCAKTDYYNTYIIASGDTLQVTGTYKQSGVYSGMRVNTGTVEAQGDVELASTSGGGTVSIFFTGSKATQTLSNAGTMPTGSWVVNKPSGAVVLGSDVTFPGKLRITSGTFSNGTTYKLTTGDSLIISTAGNYVDTGEGDITLAGPVNNSGSVIINGLGDGCGNGDSIFIRSSVNGTRRNWGGAGKFQIIDVKIRDMSSTPAITAYSSTDSLNNTSNWTIDSTCKVPIMTNVRPAAAKRSAIITVNGDNFLPTQNFGALVIGALNCGVAQSWNDSVIVDTVPASATFGTNNAIITNNAMGKDTVIFRVTNPGITIP